MTIDLPIRVTRTAKLASLPLGVAGRGAAGAGQAHRWHAAGLVTAEIQARTC